MFDHQLAKHGLLVVGQRGEGGSRKAAVLSEQRQAGSIDRQIVHGAQQLLGVEVFEGQQPVPDRAGLPHISGRTGVVERAALPNKQVHKTGDPAVGAAEKGLHRCIEGAVKDAKMVAAEVAELLDRHDAFKGRLDTLDHPFFGQAGHLACGELGAAGIVGVVVEHDREGGRTANRVEVLQDRSFGRFLVVRLDHDGAVSAQPFGRLRQFDRRPGAVVAGASIDRHPPARSFDDHLDDIEAFRLGHGNKFSRGAGRDNPMGAVLDQEVDVTCRVFGVDRPLGVEHRHGGWENSLDGRCIHRTLSLAGGVWARRAALSCRLCSWSMTGRISAPEIGIGASARRPAATAAA